MGGFYNSGVPTSVELENNKNSKKYTVNRDHEGSVHIPKSLCALMAIGALLLAVISGLLVFFLVPRCTSGEKTKETSNPLIQPILDDSNYNNSLLMPLTKEKHDEEKDERLPRSIVPQHYRLQIIPFVENATVVGTETITLLVLESTNKIIFNVKSLNIDKESLNISSMNSNEELLIEDQTVIPGEKYEITLNKFLKENSTYYVYFMFSGVLDRALHGLYRSEYRDVVTGDIKYLACTQFSPNDARMAFPSFDEPSFKATFSISIGRRLNMTALSNMPLAGKPEPFIDDNDWVWDHFQETPKMPTYLVAFIVSDLQPYRKALNESIDVWAKQDSLHQVTYAKMISPHILRYFENYTKVKFPLPKIDIVAVPDFGFSAMENWGLITFRESALLFDRYMSNMDNMRDIATVVSHELAHQWFGNLVTPKWWNDLWLKEGFATYLQYMGVNNAEPTWRIEEEFLSSETNVAVKTDALRNARPLTAAIKSNKQIRQQFDRLSYSKGSSIIRMMNHFLGENIFRNGLETFLNKYSYSNADQNDLFEIFDEEAQKSKISPENVSVGEIMRSWTHQPGFPVLTVKAARSNRSTTLTIHQHRFLYISNKEDKSSWWIPISITTDRHGTQNAKDNLWMRQGETDIKYAFEDTNWYLMNINHTGYYIVNYDIDNWKVLMKTEVFMSFSNMIRAQLISNSMDLARAGLVDYHIPLTMISNMAINDKEVMFVPTYAAFEKLQYLSNMLVSTPIYGDFENYHNTIFKNTYQKVTFAAANIDYYLTQRILSTVLEWSCRKQDSACAIESITFFREMMSNGKVVPQNIRKIVYCTALRNGGSLEWYFAYQRYLETRSPSEKNVILDALGCTNHKWLLASYLDLLTQQNTSVRLQDAARVFTAVVHNSNGYRVGFDFLRENWYQLLQNYGDGGFNLLGKMVGSISRYMNTEYQLIELINFRKSVQNHMGTTENAFDSAIEEVQANVYWMKINYKSLKEWLKQHNKHFRL